jgi:hypothetical protein
MTSENPLNVHLTRRGILASAAVATAGTLVANCSARPLPPSGVTDEALAMASGISGDPLPASRINAQRAWFEFLNRQLRLLRKFDAEDNDPLPMVRL